MTTKLIDLLIEDIEFISVGETILALQEIKVSHLKEVAALKPKARAIKVKANAQKFKLEITEGSKSFEVFLNSEKEVDKYLKDKQKFRKDSLDQWMKRSGARVPNSNHGSRDSYTDYCREHLEALANAGLNFEVKIIRC